MHRVAITGTGIFTPEEIITNAELVGSYNEYARRQNEIHAAAIAAGTHAALPFSSEEFVFKASGIERRHVMNKSGVLDPDIMHPVLRARTDDELSIIAEIDVDAAR
ncbi:MAG: beta-ketoacyl-ACP synthase III, partial [Mesorhizobium sp.]|nr:beta-ketoacyl-ACP synthase III [Mesorhizobium sp.]